MFYNYLLICYDKDFETLSWIIWLNPKCHPVCPYKRQAGTSLVVQGDKNLPVKAGDMGSVPGSGRFRGTWSN